MCQSENDFAGTTYRKYYILSCQPTQSGIISCHCRVGHGAICGGIHVLPTTNLVAAAIREDRDDATAAAEQNVNNEVNLKITATTTANSPPKDNCNSTNCNHISIHRWYLSSLSYHIILLVQDFFNCFNWNYCCICYNCFHYQHCWQH